MSRSQTVVNDALRRDGYRCQKCGKRNGLEVAHKIGLWAGGLDTLNNVVTLCAICHTYQPDNDPAKLAAYLADSLNPIQRLAVNTVIAAIRAIKDGALVEEIPAELEKAFRLSNETF